MRVLVTRPRPDAGRTAEALAERGIEALVAPVLEIRPVEIRPPGTPRLPRHCRALLLTSANAVAAVAGRDGFEAMRGLPLFAVGDRTAAAARAAGFTDVHSAGGDAADLVSLVRTSLAPGPGPLLHLSGRDIAFDLAEALGEAGYRVERAVVYEAVPVPALPADAVAALAVGDVDAVLLYSPRGAEALGRLAGAAGIADRLRPVPALALSPRVAEAARLAGFSTVLVAPSPRESALFCLLDHFVKGRGGE